MATKNPTTLASSRAKSAASIASRTKSPVTTPKPEVKLDLTRKPSTPFERRGMAPVTPKETPTPNTNYTYEDALTGRVNSQFTEFNKEYADFFGKKDKLPTNFETKAQELAKKQREERDRTQNEITQLNEIDQSEANRQTEINRRASEAAKARFSGDRNMGSSASNVTAQNQFVKETGRVEGLLQQRLNMTQEKRDQAYQELLDAQLTGRKNLVAEKMQAFAAMDTQLQEELRVQQTAERQQSEYVIDKLLPSLGESISTLSPDQLSTIIQGSDIDLPTALAMQTAFKYKAEAEKEKNEVEKAYKMAQYDEIMQKIEFNKSMNPLDIQYREAEIKAKQAEAAANGGANYTFETGVSIDETDLNSPGQNSILSYTKIYPGSPSNADGVDFAAPVGTPINSHLTGEVVEVVADKKPTVGSKGWGNRIVVVDAQGNRHAFNHLSATNVKVGDTVVPGMMIGKVGNTGRVMAGDGSELTQAQLNSGRGAHLDYTVFKPDGTKYTLGEAFKFATGSAKPVDPIKMESDIMIALSSIPLQLRNSEGESKIYRDLAANLIKQGKSPQEASDIMLGFDIKNPNDVPVARKLRTLALNTDIDISNLARAANEGDFVGAVTMVENAKLNTVDKNFANTVAAETMMEKIAKANQLSKELGGKGQGVFDEKTQKFKIKFPIFTIGENEKKAAELAAVLTQLNADVRNRFAGTAITESEGAFLENYLGSIKDQPEILGIKLAQMQSGLLSEVNAARRSVGLPEVDSKSLVDRNARVKLYRDAILPQSAPMTEQDDITLYQSISPKYDTKASSAWDNL